VKYLQARASAKGGGWQQEQNHDPLDYSHNFSTPQPRLPRGAA
jgi:hypothetical protein